jgi:hypothetical protein
MDQNLAYAACGLMIIAYAWARFNTPPSNRSSTRQALYWSSGIRYVLSALVLFAALSILLNAGPWRKLLLGPADDPALPAPLIASLAMTTLLPLAHKPGFADDVFQDFEFFEPIADEQHVLLRKEKSEEAENLVFAFRPLGSAVVCVVPDIVLRGHDHGVRIE